VRAYIPDLIDQVLVGKIDPSPVLEMSADLKGVPEGYPAIDSARKFKVIAKPYPDEETHFRQQAL